LSFDRTRLVMELHAGHTQFAAWPLLMARNGCFSILRH
jgi:hypothetical protein